MTNEQKIAIVTLCRVLLKATTRCNEPVNYEALTEIERIVQNCDGLTSPVTTPIPALEPGATVTNTEQAMMKAGELIGAIRIYKQRNNCGLKQAKDEVMGQCKQERDFYKNNVEPYLPRF